MTSFQAARLAAGDAELVLSDAAELVQHCSGFMYPLAAAHGSPHQLILLHAPNPPQAELCTMQQRCQPSTSRSGRSGARGNVRAVSAPRQDIWRGEGDGAQGAAPRGLEQAAAQLGYQRHRGRTGAGRTDAHYCLCVARNHAGPWFIRLYQELMHHLWSEKPAQSCVTNNSPRPKISSSGRGTPTPWSRGTN